MAEELRWETLFTSSTVDVDNFGEFRNDTSGDIFIRSIDAMLTVTNITATTAVNDTQMQLSKSNTIDNINNTSIFQLNLGAVSMNDEVGGVGPNATSTHLNKLYAKGQLILEPGESLFGHINFGNNPTNVVGSWTLGYHF